MRRIASSRRRVSAPNNNQRLAIAAAVAPVEMLESRRLLQGVTESPTKNNLGDLSPAAQFAKMAAEVNSVVAAPTGGSTTASPSEAGGITVGPVVNITQRSGNESEADIAINPTNPSQIFVASNISSGTGLMLASSSNAGATWTTRIGATGADIPAACCDARVEYDNFGNLWMTYLGPSGSNNYVARSTNNGASFTIVDTKTGSWDNPAITVSHPIGGNQVIAIEARGPGGVNGYQGISTGLGAAITFTAAQTVPTTSSTGNFGDIAILNDGSALITYTTPSGGQGPSSDPVYRDPDGIGTGVGWQLVLTQATNVGGFDFFPAQSGRSVDSEPAFGVAPPGTPFAGRVYFTYLDEKVNENNDTDVMLRYSDDGGVNWSTPIIVNNDATQNSQFLQQIAVDRVTGAVVLSWHDARNDNGVLPNGTNTTANDDAQFYGAVSLDGGVTFENFQIFAGWSNDNRAANGIDYGDWTGSDIYNGAMYAVWADNSQGAGGIPNNPTPNNFDLATARVEIQVATEPGVYGTVFDDANANGNRDGGEGGLAGVTVFLDLDNSGTLNGSEPSSVTGASGAYAFENLSAGTYTVRSVTPAGRRLTAPASGFHSAVVTTDPVVNLNFGFVNPRVTGTVWNDADDDGVFDASETGRSGVTVFFDANDNGSLDGGETSVVTDSNGKYIFGGLANGGYIVRAVTSAGTRQTFPGSSGNGAYAVNIGPGELFSDNNNYGVTDRVRLTGTVFNDANANGVFDPGQGELGIGGARVFIDVNNNGTFDNLGGNFSSTNVPLPIPPGAPTTTTGITTSSLIVSGALGAIQNLTVTLNITHTFTGDLVLTLISPAGTRVTLCNRRGSGGDNFTNTTFSDAAATAITAGTAPFTGSFRPEQTLSTLDGQSANGTWQLEVNDAASGDVGTLNSWSISYGGVEPNQLTGSGGTYTFTNLPAGNFVLRQLPIAGSFFTSPPGGVANITAGAGALISTDFGNSSALSSVNGFYVRLNGVGDTIEIFKNTDGSGSPDFSLPTSTPALNLVGAAGNDTVVVDLVNGSPIPTGGITFDGAGGDDTAILRGAGGDDSAVINGSSIGLSGGPSLTVSNTEALQFEGGNGNDSLNFQGSTLDATFLGQGGRNFLGVSGGTWTYDVDAGTQNTQIDVDVLAGAGINFNVTQHLTTLRLRGGVVGTLSAGGNKIIRAEGLTLASTSQLNLNNGALVLDYSGASPLATVQGQLTTGYAGGAYNGNGIQSLFANGSAASDGLGYAEASDVFTTFPGNFLGESVDNTTVLVRYTLNGDANLDGTVGIGDFSLLGANFNAAGGWSKGDFTYDSLVAIADFSLLAANFNQSVPSAPARTPVIPTAAAFSTTRIGDQTRTSLIGDVLGDPA